MYDDAPETSEPAKEPASGAAEEPSAAPTAAQPDEGDPLSLPPHGADVFVGGVPRTATSDQIRDWASKIGEVGASAAVGLYFLPSINSNRCRQGRACERGPA